ncbi:uncharacterized protein LOC127836569 [Dreissena polymorpha]|uniref:uncharacterized protein LOC127836569 n=1 Tax=Dreissena polymorpha TaxID=45954 RepID=UPI00226503FF|nr:uncharacterized protein LOC127836569 [Dreissena polymorpha]XP_052219189.1 uncharacterized protein LOC127836569 [Dreissena polymorpha]XP_052219190.1 uncharacterized protein LOC127836569 [Dreissena polymorpha]
MPSSNDSCLFGPFTARTISETQKQHYQDSVVKFKHIAEHESFEVRFIRYTHWSNALDTYNSRYLMSVLIDVQESVCERPVILKCRDGYSRSGLFAVLLCLVERNKQDGEVVVAKTVRMIRRRRNQVSTNEAQYQFCHQFMKEYIEGCRVYANS